LSLSDRSQSWAVRTEILSSPEDWVRIWGPLAALRDEVDGGRDVLTDPLHFLASTDALRRSCSVACWRGTELIGVLFATSRYLLGVPTGYAASGDFIGRGSVLCLPHHQSTVIESAVECLMHRGHSLYLNFLPAGPPSANFRGLAVKALDRCIPGDCIALQETYDGFLATLGKHTRRNVRYYTRRAAAAGIVFAQDVSKIEHSMAAARIRRGTHLSATAASLARAERLMDLHDGVRFALRDRTGKIVATLCGFSKAGRFHLLTQVNDARLAKYSLSLVLRGLTIEHLIATGHTELQFVGGSSLSLARFCPPLDYRTLLVDRPLSLATPFKILAGKLLGLLPSADGPFQSMLEVLAGGYIAPALLAERSHSKAASILQQEALANADAEPKKRPPRVSSTRAA
jgi:hypothetical protein